jgi:hypothetical protein
MSASSSRSYSSKSRKPADVLDTFSSRIAHGICGQRVPVWMFADERFSVTEHRAVR